LLPASIIAITIAHVGAIAVDIAIAIGAIARPLPSSPLPSLLSPSPSSSHATLVANAMTLATLALLVAQHPLCCHHCPALAIFIVALIIVCMLSLFIVARCRGCVVTHALLPATACF
jgi:hypothetical protein